MVNITVFGPWSGKKAATVDKAGLTTIGAGGLDSYDTEAHLLGTETDSRWNRRGKFCYLAFVADICAFLALLLIIISTGFLLWKVWWVKAEVDKMQPAVMSLSASLSRLQVESEALQSENSALINAYSSQNGAVQPFGSGNSFDTDDTLMEDASVDSLTQLVNQEKLAQELDGAEAGLVGMTIYMTVGKTDSDPEGSNLTEELKALFDQTQNAASDDDSDDDDDLPRIYPILDAGDNSLQTTTNPAVVDSAVALPSEAEISKTFRQVFGDAVPDDEEDADEEDIKVTPKRKTKDLADSDDDDEDDNDDDDDTKSAKSTSFAEDNLSDSD
ncbi:hypothetical protein BV898_17268 [Hypsibius exemplaris]|uniref:Uncharacterized protein n=1 Tax=Hypsibius exemplaris TaxID=2072580 RepID=A0A9X6NF85_HYPEX|nr:hypothetical protein BV898_17268 [Hypsibius exemplaris]